MLEGRLGMGRGLRRGAVRFRNRMKEVLGVDWEWEGSLPGSRVRRRRS